MSAKSAYTITLSSADGQQSVRYHVDPSVPSVNVETINNGVKTTDTGSQGSDGDKYHLTWGESGFAIGRGKHSFASVEGFQFTPATLLIERSGKSHSWNEGKWYPFNIDMLSPQRRLVG